MTDPTAPSEAPGSHDGGLEGLKSVRRADVYKDGELAAHLTRAAAGVVQFTYTDDWLRNDAPPVATTLPVTATPVVTSGGAVPAFFSGLLPEGRRLTALRQGIKTSMDDEFSLLLGVGSDTIGDVRVVPEGGSPEGAPARLRVTSFNEVRFADLIESMGIQVDRVGLPGVQDKVSAAMLNLPVTAAGSHLLLKLNPAEFKHLVENEDFFLRAARRSHIRTVDAQLVHDAEGVPGLAVARFDRVEVDGRPASLAVEDGCQVLGMPPAGKYLVSTEELFAKLSSLCEAPIPAAANFLSQIAFANLTGNGDAHAKNFSIIQDRNGRWQPTLAYDVPTSQIYNDQTMALPIHGRRDGHITGARFVALGAAIGLRERPAVRVLHTVARAADGWIDELDTLPFDKGKLHELKRVVMNRQQMLRQ